VETEKLRPTAPHEEAPPANPGILNSNQPVVADQKGTLHVDFMRVRQLGTWARRRTRQTTTQIRINLTAIYEASTNAVAHALAIGDALNTAKRLVGHGNWMKWLSTEFQLSGRSATSYMKLAKSRAKVEAYSQRAANMNEEFSIRAALRLISPPRLSKPAKPKTFLEISTPALLGRFLDGNQELFFEALQHAPALKPVIEQRLQRPLGDKIRKAARRAARRGPIAPLVARGDAASIH
jgi:hypothetical protein